MVSLDHFILDSYSDVTISIIIINTCALNLVCSKLLLSFKNLLTKNVLRSSVYCNSSLKRFIISIRSWIVQINIMVYFSPVLILSFHSYLIRIDVLTSFSYIIFLRLSCMGTKMGG